MSLRLRPDEWTSLELLVDSGSNASGVFAGVAAASGVALGRLPWGDLSVVGGRSTQPFLEEAAAALVGEGFKGVRLRPLWILTGSENLPGEGEEGGILGLDALRAFGARVTLDLRQGVGWIEW